MNKQATQGGNHSDPNGSSPPWWTTKHATAWEGAKEALVVVLEKRGAAPAHKRVNPKP